MHGKILFLNSDSYGSYLGIHINREKIIPFLKQMKKYLGNSSFEKYSNNQNNRDNNAYHITLVNPFEYLTLSDYQKVEFVGMCVSYSLVGLGRVRKKEEEAYFIVVYSADLSSFRIKLNLASKDFHITTGFKKDDVHDIGKDHSSIVEII